MGRIAFINSPTENLKIGLSFSLSSLSIFLSPQLLSLSLFFPSLFLSLLHTQTHTHTLTHTSISLLVCNVAHLLILLSPASIKKRSNFSLLLLLDGSSNVVASGFTFFLLDKLSSKAWCQTLIISVNPLCIFASERRKTSLVDVISRYSEV